MPIYEYRCAQCGAEFELLVRRDTIPACPQCRSEKVDKRMSAPAATRSESNAPCGGECGGSPASCGCAGACGCGRRH